MRINPLNIVLDGKTQLDKNFYFITGNEITFIEKIKDKILENYRKDKGNKIERLKDLTQITNDVGLFEKRNIYLTSSINDIDNDLLDKSHVRGDILLIYVENSPKSKLLKKLLRIKNGKIAVIAENITDADKILDATNKLCLPGGIEAHCHIEQESGMGIMAADDYKSGSISAVYGGNTTIVPFAAQHRGQSLREVVKIYHERARPKSVIDYAFHLIISDATEQVLGQELPALIKDGYTSFKVFLHMSSRIMNIYKSNPIHYWKKG